MSSGAGVLVVPLSLLFVGVLVVLLRWTYSSGSSVVSRRSRSGHAEEYGLLVAVAAPGTYIEGEVLRQTLESAGIRANLAETLDGPRVLVFPGDAARARSLLRTA